MEKFDQISELYFLIGKFLLNSPFQNVAQVRNEANAHAEHTFNLNFHLQIGLCAAIGGIASK
jgi:hypothetical protein